MTRTRPHARNWHHDEPLRTAAGLRLVAGLMLANLLALAILTYTLLLLGIATMSTGWGWALVFTCTMAILPLSATATIVRIGDYGRRARTAAVAMVATVSFGFTVAATTIVLLRIVMPEALLAANMAAAQLCETICPADIYAGYIEDMQRLHFRAFGGGSGSMERRDEI